MSQVMEKLTPEQEALMFAIRDEWIKIALDTSPTNKQKAEEAIKLIYESAGLKPPQQIVWFENPLAALSWIVFNKDILGRFFNYPIWFDFTKSIDDDIDAVVDDAIEDSIRSHYFYQDWENGEEFNHFERIVRFIGNTLDETLFQDFGDEYDTIWSCIIEDATEDYPNGVHQIDSLAFYAYFHAIGVDCSKLEGWWRFANECGIWWSFAEVAVLTPKPSILRLDARGRLHSERQPAVVYEGLSLYAYHGVLIPEKYGRLHPNEWQPQWLLEEENTSLRRVLIQGIGYERTAQELGAIELDVFQEYSLLKIDTDIDDEPIHLLKMTCPSTGYIHVLRVPPDMISAREAIRWVNWGIDPEEFSVQT